MAEPDGVPGTDGPTLAESRAECKNYLKFAGTSPDCAPFKPVAVAAMLGRVCTTSAQSA